MGLSVWRETSKKLTVYRVCYTPIETLKVSPPSPPPPLPPPPQLSTRCNTMPNVVFLYKQQLWKIITDQSTFPFSTSSSWRLKDVLETTATELRIDSGIFSAESNKHPSVTLIWSKCPTIASENVDVVSRMLSVTALFFAAFFIISTEVKRHTCFESVACDDVEIFHKRKPTTSNYRH